MYIVSGKTFGSDPSKETGPRKTEDTVGNSAGISAGPETGGRLGVKSENIDTIGTETDAPGPLAEPETAGKLTLSGGEIGSRPYSGKCARRVGAYDRQRRPYGGRFRRHVRAEDASDGRRSAVLYAMTALSAAGFVTGCAAWSKQGARDQCAGIAGGYTEFAKGSGFAECFSAGLRQQLPLFLMLTVCSLVVIGFAGCCVLLFVRGMGSAVALCSLFAEGVSGCSVCAAAYIAASTAVLTLIARDSADISLGCALGSCAAPRPRGNGGGLIRWAGFAAKLVLYGLLLTAAAALHAALVCVLCR